MVSCYYLCENSSLTLLFYHTSLLSPLHPAASNPTSYVLLNSPHSCTIDPKYLNLSTLLINWPPNLTLWSLQFYSTLFTKLNSKIPFKSYSFSVHFSPIPLSDIQASLLTCLYSHLLKPYRCKRHIPMHFVSVHPRKFIYYQRKQIRHSLVDFQ